jgi:hypothetical protein
MSLEVKERVPVYLGEMATIGRNEEKNFLVIINPSENFNNAYFKYCNDKSYEKCTKVIRISFKKLEYFHHTGDGKKFWKITNKDKKNLMDFFKSKTSNRKYLPTLTNWEVAIYSWNDILNFTNNNDWDDSFPEGCDPESELFKNPQFVRMNMPLHDYTKLEI